MANPVLIKAAVMLLTDKRTWKAIGVVIAAVLTPFILIIIMVGAMLYGTASHNNAAVELTFYGGSIPITMPGEYRDYITEMRSCFSSLDGAIAAVEEMMEDGDSLDSNRIKAVFLCAEFRNRKSVPAPFQSQGVCGLLCGVPGLYPHLDG